MISGQADAATAKRAHDDAKVQLAAAQTTAGQAPARRRGGRGRPAGPQYDAAVASAFASPELAAQLAQDGVTVRAICEWLVGEHGVSEFRGKSVASTVPKGVSKVLNNRPEYVFRWVGGTPVWRRVSVDGMDVEAPPPAVQAPHAMDVSEPAPPPVAPPPVAHAPVAPVAQAPSPAVVAQAPSPAVVAPTPPRAPPDVAWGFDTSVYSVEAKFASRLKHFIQFGHYLEDGPNLTFLDRMDEVHGLVVVVETADEKFALVGATPRIAAGIRSGRFYAATQGEDCFFVTVESDARRPYERRSRPHTRFRSRRRRRVSAQQAAGLRR